MRRPAGARALTIGTLTAAVGWPLGLALARLWPGTVAVAIAVAATLAALEAVVSHERLWSRELEGRALLRFRVVEFALLYLLVRLITVVVLPGSEALEELAGWVRRPLGLFSAGALPTYLVAVGSWLAASAACEDLDRLDAPEVAAGTYQPPFESIFRRFLLGGVVLLLALASLGLHLEPTPHVAHPEPGWTTFAALAYLAIGLAALGRVRLQLMRGRWQRQGVTLDPGLGARWGVHTGLLVAGGLILATTLPTPSGAGVRTLAQQLAGGFFRWLGEWIRTRARERAAERMEPPPAVASPFADASPPPAAEELPTPVPDAPSLPGWLTEAWATAWPVLAWLAGAAMLTYVVVAYVRDRPDLRLRHVRVWHWLRAALAAIRRQLALFARWLRGRIARLRSTGTHRTASATDRERKRGRPPRTGRRAARAARGPRGRVLRSYLSLVEAAERAGIARRPAQTPHEYGPILGTRLADERARLSRLTDDFLVARYADHPVSDAQAHVSEEDARVLRDRLSADPPAAESH